MRVTHTFAELKVSREAYLEIYTLLAEAGYHHAFIDGAIDMKGIALTKGKERAPDLPEEMRKELHHMVETGHVRIELCGHLACADSLKGFTLDKRKYKMRFEDETEESVRVTFDRIDNNKGEPMLEASEVQREMPRYKSHKEVHALKIKAIYPAPESVGGGYITPEEPGYGDIHVDAAYMAKHQPQAGGYYVVYKDGYASFSPAEAFEDGYTLVN